MSSDAVNDAPRNDLSTRGQPFGGSVQNYAKPIDPTTDPTEIPAHLRMNSRTALFPSNRTNTNRRRHRDSHSSDLEDRCQEAMGGASGRGVAGLNATLGLVIHAMADGVALGASSLSGSGGLGLVVFLAVIVHKGESLLFLAVAY
jgi:zinc transporter 9